jgi:hypothetical protein
MNLIGFGLVVCSWLLLIGRRLVNKSLSSNLFFFFSFVDNFFLFWVLDLGYMINHAMFQRNGRSGYVLKPPAIRLSQKKELLAKRTFHSFEVTIISAQQLPKPRDASSGLQVLDKGIVDPYVEVTLYIPDWPVHHVDSKKK